MLSRFTKLPSLSTLLSASQRYSQDDVDKAIAQVKTLGKREVNNSDECLQDIQRILSLTSKFSESLHVQRVACHALSNLAMSVVAARWIIQKGGFQLISAAIDRFTEDHKLCWLASSAVWNLARPPVNRGIIGQQGVRLMLKILSEHNGKEKVTNTAIGALSNLSLQDDLKDYIADNMELVLESLEKHCQLRSLSVMTSAAGLLANLAVNDDHASVLVSKDVLSVLMQLLTWNLKLKSENPFSAHWNNEGVDEPSLSEEESNDEMDDTLHRNTCAALNNLVTAEGFLESFLRHLGIEKVFLFLSEYRHNELYMNLLENCLVNVDADTSVKTSTFHLCAYHGKLDILKQLYSEHRHTFDLNAVDMHGMTPLDYAIAHKRLPVIEWLCRCGATEYNHSSEQLNSKIEAIMDSASKQLNKVRSNNQKALIQALPHVPTDLCKYFLKFQHNVDLLSGMDLY